MDFQQAVGDEQALAEALMKLRMGGYEADPNMTSGIATLNFAPFRKAALERQMGQELETAKRKRADVGRNYLEQALLEQRRYKEARETNPKAYLDFEGSTVPQVAEQAKADRKIYEADALERSKAGLKGATPASILGGGPLVPKKDIREIDGAFAEVGDDGRPRLLEGTGYDQVPGPNGEQINRNRLTGKVSNQGGMRQSLDFGDKTGTKTLIEGMPKQAERAEAMNSALRGTETALSALGEGARAGYGEEFFQNARTLISGITGVKFDSTTPTAVLAKALAKNVIDELGGLGAQISNSDREFMATAIGGLNTDPTALERILAIRMGALQRLMSKYGRTVEANSQLVGGETGEALKTNYGVERARVSASFKSPEAEASYIANLNNIPYQAALQQVMQMRATDPKPTPGTSKGGRSREEILRQYGVGQ